MLAASAAARASSPSPTIGLSEAVTVQQVAHVGITQSLSVVGAQIGNVVLVSDDGEWLEVVDSQGVSTEAGEQYVVKPI